MKSIALRIRKEYFDAIITGDKTVEYRPDSRYWRTRLGYPEPFPPNHPKFPKRAVFVCGKRVHRRKTRKVDRIPRPDGFSPQGQQDVPTPMCYAIYLETVIK